MDRKTFLIKQGVGHRLVILFKSCKKKLPFYASVFEFSELK